MICLFSCCDFGTWMGLFGLDNMSEYVVW